VLAAIVRVGGGIRGAEGARERESTVPSLQPTPFNARIPAHEFGVPKAAWFASSICCLFEQNASQPPHFAGQNPFNRLKTMGANCTPNCKPSQSNWWHLYPLNMVISYGKSSHLPVPSVPGRYKGGMNPEGGEIVVVVVEREKERKEGRVRGRKRKGGRVRGQQELNDPMSQVVTSTTWCNNNKCNAIHLVLILGGG
jgi:hypothetical protein